MNTLQYDPSIRWVYFSLPLEQPYSIAAGQTVPLKREEYEALKSAPGGDRAVYDVTPIRSLYVMSEAGLVATRSVLAALFAYPCPACGTRQGATFTECTVCRDIRRVWGPLQGSRTRFAEAQAWFRLAVDMTCEQRWGTLRKDMTVDEYRRLLNAQVAGLH